MRPSNPDDGEAVPFLSVVIPCLNEAEVLPRLQARLKSVLDGPGLSWEAILVDDGSSDNTYELLQHAHLADRRFKCISLSRNFGHQAAIAAGLDHARGDVVAVMDADLQDPPEVVGQMVARWREGFDVVFGVRSRRHGESAFKKLTAAIFYRLLRGLLGDVSIPVDAGDFRLMSRPVVLTLRALRERHRFVRGLVWWVGFRQTSVSYERPARFAGETKWPLRKMLRFAADGITSFSTVPLRMATWLGVLAGMVALGGVGWALYSKFFGGVVRGWTTIMILVGLGSSAQLLMTGILGEYVGRIYEEVKRRPLYVVESEINLPREPADSDRGSRSPETR
jgi:dolichol-phosphate mannosyltransferase